MIAVCGRAGSGKTSVAALLRHRLGLRCMSVSAAAMNELGRMLKGDVGRRTLLLREWMSYVRERDPVHFVRSDMEVIDGPQTAEEIKYLRSRGYFLVKLGFSRESSIEWLVRQGVHRCDAEIIVDVPPESTIDTLGYDLVVPEDRPGVQEVCRMIMKALHV